MALSEDEISKYTKIIDGILITSDLNTISEKRIRKGLQTALGYDLTPQKDAVKRLIMDRFDKSMADRDAEEKRAKKNTINLTNGHVKSEPSETKPLVSPAPSKVRSEAPSPSKKHKLSSDFEDVENGSVKDEYDSSEMQDLTTPKKKKRKVEEDSDAVLARQLQAQENVRIRNTRGGGPKKANVVKRKSIKKKTAAKVRAEDDSEIDEDGNPKKEVRRNGAFHKELHLSQPLSDLLDGEIKLSRPQTVKRIWAYIRERNLQDPNDKRMIVCDDRLRGVFKQEKVHMFTMNKILAQNLYPIE